MGRERRSKATCRLWAAEPGASTRTSRVVLCRLSRDNGFLDAHNASRTVYTKEDSVTARISEAKELPQADSELL